MADDEIFWSATEEPHEARDLSRASMRAVARGDKRTWVAMFAEDGFVADPVGPSMFDPEGNGHHGHEAIAAFWDTAIAQAQRIEFHIADSFAAGDESANVGFIRTFLPDGSSMDAEGVFVYRSAGGGLLRSLRAFWEVDRAMGTLRSAG